MENCKGFTLIELLVTCTILVLVIGLSAGSWQGTIIRTQADRAAELTSDYFRQGRLAAINNNKYVTLCPSEDYQQCSNNWKHDWIIFTDQNKNKQIDDGEMLIRVFDTSLDQFHLKVKPSNRNFFRWEAMGITHGSPGSVQLCSDSTPQANRKITLSMLGRTRLSKDLDGDGIHEDSSGDDIRCI